MTDRDECKECRLVRRWAANWGAPNPTARCCQCRLQEAVARVRELEARCLDLRSLADQHAHESGLYARRMAQAQSARDKAEARVAELEAAIRVHRDDYHSVGADPEALCLR